jgi:hypothetical protein
LAAAEQQHGDDPARAELLARTRRFKAGWFELAEGLTEARRTEAWRRWGYPTFDDYCKKELHLRKETVDKLTGSFGFLHRRAPEVLSRRGEEAPIPSYQAVDLWRRAEEVEAPADTVSEIRRHVLEEGTSAPRISRLYKSVLFPVDGDSDDADVERERRRRALFQAAERLGELLSDSQGVIPRVLVEAISEPLTALREAVAPPQSEGRGEGRRQSAA